MKAAARPGLRALFARAVEIQATVLPAIVVYGTIAGSTCRHLSEASTCCVDDATGFGSLGITDPDGQEETSPSGASQHDLEPRTVAADLSRSGTSARGDPSTATDPTRAHPYSLAPKQGPPA